MPELRLNGPQRRAIGVRLRAVADSVQTLRRTGLDGDPLDAIERVVAEAAAAAEVSPPLPQRSLVAAMVAEILIVAVEVKPGNLRRYGALDDETARWLELLSRRLTELVDGLDPPVPAVGGRPSAPGSGTR